MVMATGGKIQVGSSYVIAKHDLRRAVTRYDADKHAQAAVGEGGAVQDAKQVLMLMSFAERKREPNISASVMISLAHRWSVRNKKVRPRRILVTCFFLVHVPARRLLLRSARQRANGPRPCPNHAKIDVCQR
jgi:hypothetical protein